MFFFSFISRNIQLKCVELFNHMEIYAAESNVNHNQRGLVCQIFVSLMAFHLELFSPNGSF